MFILGTMKPVRLKLLSEYSSASTHEVCSAQQSLSIITYSNPVCVISHKVSIMEAELWCTAEMELLLYKEPMLE